MKPKPSKKDIFIFILMGCTAVLISVAGIYHRQSFLLILPLYVSLVIGMLQSRVNRFANLLGGINSLLYGAVYIHYTLYGSALSAILFSCPIQLITFIRWNKNKQGHSTLLRKMNLRQRVLLVLGLAVSMVAAWIVLTLVGSDYVFLDSVTTLLGIFIYFLTMFAFIEYTLFMVINCTITVILYITMLRDTPEMLAHLIYSVYSLICTIFSVFEARKIYRNQQQNKSI